MAEQWVITKLDELTKAHAELEADVMVLKLAKADARADLIELFRRMERLEANIAALEPPATPAPDPVCPIPDCNPKSCNRAYCYATDSVGAGIVPTEQPAPAPLDPVLVEAAAKAAWEYGQRAVLWDDIYPSLREELIKNAEVIIRAYVGEATRDE